MDTREFGGKVSEEGTHMPKSTGSRYTKEFKAEAVQLARFSPERSIRQLAYTSLASPTRLYATGSGRHRSTAASARAFPPKSVRS